MKYLAIVLIAFAASVAAEEEWKPCDPEAFFRISDECKRESGVTAEQLERIASLQFPNEKEVHNYVLCPALKMGIFTEDKGYNLDRMVAQMGVFTKDTDGIRETFAACIDNNEEKSSPAEWAFRGQQCMFKDKIQRLRNHFKF